MNHPRSAFGASPSKGAPPAERPGRIRGVRLVAAVHLSPVAPSAMEN